MRFGKKFTLGVFTVVFLLLAYNATVDVMTDAESSMMYVLDDGENNAVLVVQNDVQGASQTYYYDNVNEFCSAVSSLIVDQEQFQAVVLNLGLSGCGGNGLIEP